MKTFVLTVSVIVLALGTMWYYGTYVSAEPADTGQLPVELSEASYDFGNISMGNGIVTREVEVRNPGVEPIAIRTITTSCMCTEALAIADGVVFGPFSMPGHGIVPKANVVIPPGGSMTLRIQFDPAAHGPAGIGPAARSVYLSDEIGRQVQVDIRASVTP